MTYFDREHPRIFRDETIHLRQQEDRAILGPTLADIGMKHKRILVVSEILLFLAFAAGGVCFVLCGEVGFHYIVAAMVLFSTVQMAVMGGLVYTVWKKTSRCTRLTISKSGIVTIKNESNENVTLPPQSDVTFLCTTDADRDGRDVYDVYACCDREQYYLLSGRDRDDMERLRDALEKLLNSPASAPLG